MTLAATIIFRIVNHKYEFLLLKRLPVVGGFWQYAGGSIEDGEDHLEAAYREVFEEAGIAKKDVIRVIDNVYYFTMDKHYLTNEPMPIQEEFVYAFEVKPNTKININNNPCSEHDAYRWVDFDSAMKMLKWDNNKDAFNKLKKILKLS